MTSQGRVNKMATYIIWRDSLLVVFGVLLLAGTSNSQGQPGFYFGQDNRFAPNFQTNSARSGNSFFDQTGFGGQFNQPQPQQPQGFSSQSYDSRYRQQPASFQTGNQQYFINQGDYRTQTNTETVHRPGPFQNRPISAASYQFGHPASTTRPEFSQYVQTSHNHDPSKPETFLGQITINNPDPYPDNPDEVQHFSSARVRQPEYNTNILRTPSLDSADFDSGFPNAAQVVNQDIYEYTEKTRPTTYNPIRTDYSSRIKPSNRGAFNPRPSFYSASKPEETNIERKPLGSINENYFSSNENNFSNTRNRFKPKPTTTTTPAPQTERKNKFTPTTKSSNRGLAFHLKSNKVGFSPNKPHYSSTTEYKPLFDLEPLLEDEIPDSRLFGDTLRKSTNGSEDVEVIKSKVTEKYDTSTSEDHLSSSNRNGQETTVDPGKDFHGQDFHGQEYETTELNKDEENTDSVSEVFESEYTTEYPNLSDVKKVSELSKDVPDDSRYATTISNTNNDEQLDTSVVTEYYDEDAEYVDETDVVPDKKIEKQKAQILEQNSSKVIPGKEVESHHDEEVEYEEVEESAVPVEDTTADGETFDILTMKPKPTMVKDDNFKGFVDSALIDNTEPPTFVTEHFVEPEAHADDITENVTTDPPPILLGEEVVSVVTTKSVVNGTFSVVDHTISPQKSTIQMNGVTEKPISSTSTNSSDDKANKQTSTVPNATESWVVVASVQTSRSVSGARFLPFPAVAQSEKKEPLDADGEPSDETDTIAPESHTVDPASMTKEYVSHDIKSPSSTESIIDKLDRVQSELSGGFLSGGFKDSEQDFAVLTEMPHENITKEEITTVAPNIQVFTVRITSTTSTTERSTPEPLPVTIKKFSPYSRPSTTTLKPKTKQPFDSITMDDLAGFLPAGFKVRPSFRDRKITTTTEKLTKTTTHKPEIKKDDFPISSEKAGIALKNKVVFKEDLSTLLPKGYKPQKEEKPPSIEDLFKNIKPDDLAQLLPPGYKAPGKTASSSEKPSKFNKSAGALPKAEPVDVSSLLPKGYKHVTGSNEKTKPTNETIPLIKTVDISAFLPPGFKLNTTAADSLDKVKIVDVSSLLPPGYNKKPSDKESNTKGAEATTAATTVSKPASNGFKVVFPSRPGAGKPGKRLTTPRPSNEAAMSGGVSLPSIQKGWPTRATTEFTGWPTPSTTPFSIEKLLEAQRAATATSESSAEASTSTAAPKTTTPTTTTTSTSAPTTPGQCGSECDLAATIKIVGGVKWVPELLDHNTKEWQLLANEVSRELNTAYSKSPNLKKWYKGIRIDSFSEGSVLVDYFVELNEIGEKIDTGELKKMFHTSLKEAPAGSVVEEVKTDDGTPPPDRLTGRKIDGFDPDMMLGDQPLEDRLEGNNESVKKIDRSKGKLEIGKFILDPVYTEFIVLPKRLDPSVGFAEDNMLLPQWGIAVIVIALASLLFVVIFGVTVLVNRQKNSKAKQPIPLSEDMLRELDKSHMGGPGQDDLYMHEHEPPYPPRNKRGSTAMLDPLPYPGNPGDSWRSEWGPYYNQYHQQHYAPDSGRGSQSYTGGNTNYGYSGSQTYGYNGGGGGGSQNYGYSGEGVRTLYPRRRSDFDSNF